VIYLVGLFRANPRLTREVFIALVEERYVQLIEQLLPPSAKFRRNYVVPTQAIGMLDVAPLPPGCDALIEIALPDEAAFTKMTVQLRKYPVEDLSAADGARLFDPGSVEMIRVDRAETPARSLAPRPAGHDGDPVVRMAALLRRKAGLSRAGFIDYYECHHAPLALDLFQEGGHPSFAEYRRSYPLADARARFDALTEIAFWDRTGFDAFLRLYAIPERERALSGDEENFLERASMINFPVEHAISAL
jgi:hypothetical protein